KTKRRRFAVRRRECDANACSRRGMQSGNAIVPPESAEIGGTEFPHLDQRIVRANIEGRGAYGGGCGERRFAVNGDRARCRQLMVARLDPECDPRQPRDGAEVRRRYPTVALLREGVKDLAITSGYEHVIDAERRREIRSKT